MGEQRSRRAAAGALSRGLVLARRRVAPAPNDRSRDCPQKQSSPYIRRVQHTVLSVAGLKGSMSEYELSLLRQRGLAARDSKAQRGELKFALPPGYCWNELGQIEMDPDDRVCEAIRMVMKKFRELGSVRQVLLWAAQGGLQLPVMRQSQLGARVEWKNPAYHTVLLILRHPVYAGAYVFGRTTQRTKIVDGRARKTNGHQKPMPEWSVLIRDHHPGYINWDEFQQNQKMISENAHMQKRADRKSARGGRALLAGLVRCGRCGRMMRVFYGSKAGHVHRYHCRGNIDTAGGKPCIGAGGVRVDRAVSTQILEAISADAIEAAIQAAERSQTVDDDMRTALTKELEAARYEASLAARRYDLVDPAQRLVARELEARWNSALELLINWNGGSTIFKPRPSGGLGSIGLLYWPSLTICPRSGIRQVRTRVPNNG